MSEEVEELLVQARLADAALSLDERKPSAALNATPIAECAIAVPLKPVERVISTLKLLGVHDETSRAAACRAGRGRAGRGGRRRLGAGGSATPRPYPCGIR